MQTCFIIYILFIQTRKRRANFFTYVWWSDKSFFFVGIKTNILLWNSFLTCYKWPNGKHFFFGMVLWKERIFLFMFFIEILVVELVAAAAAMVARMNHPTFRPLAFFALNLADPLHSSDLLCCSFLTHWFWHGFSILKKKMFIFQSKSLKSWVLSIFIYL